MSGESDNKDVLAGRPSSLALVVALALPAVIACTSRDGGSDGATKPHGGATTIAEDAGGLSDDPSLPELCRRPDLDDIKLAFCSKEPPSIQSLADLQRVLEIANDPYSVNLSGVPPAFLSHSTSLEGHVVTAINPRVILTGGSAAATVMAFQRGAQQVELAALRRSDSAPTFYLLTFQQACNDTERGCVPGDLFTPRVESDWTRVTLQDDEDLKNTPSDCRQCHQRGTDGPLLLMRELEAPWTHFFAPEGETDTGMYKAGISGGLFTTEYLAAKGDESYGGVSAESLPNTSGIGLEQLVKTPQPLLFDAPKILAERYPYSATGEPWPGTPQRSRTWYDAYEAFKRGEQLALPYFDAHATDARKLAAMTTAYQSFRAGNLAAEELPDLGDAFPDDPQTRAEIGLETEPNATPAEALVQACGGCHNDVLDQNISRARFNIALGKLDEDELLRAVERLERPGDTPGVMPPPKARALTPEVRARLVDYLRKGDVTDADRAFLEHAAAAGMTGTAQ